MKDENVIKDKSFAFAIRIVKLYNYLTNEKKEYVLSKQILRSGTSIGANIREAVVGQTTPMFIAKLNIALCEANETEYWIDVLNATEYLANNEIQTLKEECVELIKLLTSIIKKTRENLNN